MHKPLAKQFRVNSNDSKLLSSYIAHTEVPTGPLHLGAFGAIRKNHIHEGVDLYCLESDPVFSMLKGTVIAVIPFTGEHAGSPWWNNTFAVLVDHGDFVINYGEVFPLVKKGDKVYKGAVLGAVTPVLKKDKGRPISMLHIEKYVAGTCLPINEWALGTPQPLILQDPTELLLSFVD